MKLTKITDNAWQLTRLGLLNCYLVRESDGFTLVDTTIAGSGKDIVGMAAHLNAPIQRILLTHAHVDHVGSVDELKTLLPEASVATSERSVPLLSKPADKTLRPGEPKDSFGGGLPGIAAKVDHFVEDGELYGSLRVIETPGHIPGHLSFLDERDGTLYAGDELTGVGRLAVCGYTPWYFPLPTWVMWSKALAVQSAQRLLKLPIERFACGHGAVRSGGVAELQAVLQQIPAGTV